MALEFRPKTAPLQIQLTSDEAWKDVTFGNTTYQVSSNGRFRRPSGVTNIGTAMSGKKCRYVTMTYKDAKNMTHSKRAYIHRLMWEAFNGPIPDGHFVMHKTDAPLLPDGSHRSWLGDLWVGLPGTTAAVQEEDAVLEEGGHDEDGEQDGQNIITTVIESRPRHAATAKEHKTPVGFWIQKAAGGKGAAAVVDIKRAVKNGTHLQWKSPSSLVLGLEVKIEVAKKMVRWVLARHPDVAKFVDCDGCKENVEGLTEDDLAFYNNFTFREKDDPFRDKTKEEEKTKRRTVLPPVESGITGEMMPKFCSYRASTEIHGEKFLIENHPNMTQRTWSTPTSHKYTTKQKYDLMMVRLGELNIGKDDEIINEVVEDDAYARKLKEVKDAAAASKVAAGANGAPDGHNIVKMHYKAAPKPKVVYARPSIQNVAKDSQHKANIALSNVRLKRARSGMTDAIIDKVRELIAAKKSNKEVEEKLGLTRAVVSRIKNGNMIKESEMMEVGEERYKVPGELVVALPNGAKRRKISADKHMEVIKYVYEHPMGIVELEEKAKELFDIDISHEVSKNLLKGCTMLTEVEFPVANTTWDEYNRLIDAIKVRNYRALALAYRG